MLQNLHIQNYALIDNLSIELSNGFVAITGETGAGKSIILGALGLLLGKRANISAISSTKKKCIIEGEFAIRNYNLETFFIEQNLDYEPITIIRRELSPSGKSRAFINDTPVDLKTLRTLTTQLVDIHSQHQNLEIENEPFQFRLVDSLAKNTTEQANYVAELQKLQKLQHKRETLLTSQKQQTSDIDYWQFQLNELQTVNFQVDELEKLETENALFSQLENIQEALSQADAYFYSEQSPIENLKKFAYDFQKVQNSHTPSQEFAERLQSCYIELKDVAQEVSKELENLQADPERSNFISERLDTIYRLLQKHDKKTLSELLDLQKQLEKKVNSVANFDENLANLDKEISQQLALTNDTASTLSQTRTKIIPKIENEITQQLHKLGMPNAQIRLDLQPSESFRTQGKEHLNILFSANKNSQLANISEVASGGEISRLMLTIKQLMGKSLVLPTLIFDEIDTGISGEIATKMGEMMQIMATQMQVITITHLPQIAVKATQHWEVFKEDTDEKTLTSIQILTKEKRTEAIAKMLSGSKITNEALANAKVLLENK